MDASSLDYRRRILDRYTTAMHQISGPVSPASADRWGWRFDHYLRGWLPDSKNVRIVDLGCGYGRLLRFFSKRGFNDLLGVDVSPEQVELARRMHSRVEQADVLEFLADQSESFDLITAFDIIEHFHKDEVFQFLDACHRALKPGGRIILKTLNANNPSMSLRYGDFTHEVAFTPKSLDAVMRQCRFSRLEMREMGPFMHNMRSTVRTLIWRLVKLQWRFLARVDMGLPGYDIYARDFLASGVRQP